MWRSIWLAEKPRRGARFDALLLLRSDNAVSRRRDRLLSARANSISHVRVRICPANRAPRPKLSRAALAASTVGPLNRRGIAPLDRPRLLRHPIRANNKGQACGRLRRPNQVCNCGGVSQCRRRLRPNSSCQHTTHPVCSGASLSGSARPRFRRRRSTRGFRGERVLFHRIETAGDGELPCNPLASSIHRYHR